MTDEPAGLLAARYRLLRPLGEGGMGVVWQARDQLLDRDVAVKELAPNGLTEAELGDLRERAIREARAIARVDHVNVVRIFDVVHDDEGAPWIVMELVRSRSLHDIVNEDGPVAPERAAEIGLAVLTALRAAHEAGILHRDVKPANVLLATNGRIVLTDFGLAEMAGDSAMTRTGVVLGSPSYLAPERALDERPGPAADLWSLGATLYAAVEGRPPYEKSSPMATLAALMIEPPPPPERAGALRPVLDALLRKNPAERATADEAERLLQAVASPTTAATVSSPAPDSPPSAATATEAVDRPPVGSEPVDKTPAAPNAVEESATGVSAIAEAVPVVDSTVPSEPAAPAPETKTATGVATTAALFPGKRGRRRHWLIAAAVVVIAAGSAAWPLTRSDGAEGIATGASAAPAAAWASSAPAGVAPAAVGPQVNSTPVGTRAATVSGAPPPSSAPATKPGAPVAPKPTNAATRAATAPAAPPAATTKPATKAPVAQAPAPGIQVWSHETGTCLDARNTGGDLQLWSCQARDSQRFTFPSDGTMRSLGLCVRIKGTGNGARLGMGSCTGSSAQLFDLNGSNDLVSNKVDKCVDVTDSAGGNGVPAQLWDCAGTDNQKWN